LTKLQTEEKWRARSKVWIAPIPVPFPTHFKYPLPKVKTNSLLSHIVAIVVRAVDAFEMLTLREN